MPPLIVPVLFRVVMVPKFEIPTDPTPEAKIVPLLFSVVIVASR